MALLWKLSQHDGLIWGISNQRCVTSNTRQHPSCCDQPLQIQQAQAQLFLCWPQASNFTSPCFVFSSLSLAPQQSPSSSLESTPKQDITPAAALGTAVLAEEIASSLLPTVSAGHCVLKQLPDIGPFLRFCPQTKEEGPHFATTHATLVPASRHKPCLASGVGTTSIQAAMSRQDSHKCSLPSPFRGDHGSNWLQTGK